ncbi:N-acetyltransferase domain-containing protein [Aphelenchoides besseyi]|nr:N-acetyltransferase domain-containing protein [Aphelenchoides besseyi]
MEKYAILRNPGQEYWNQIVKYLVSNENWVSSLNDYQLFLNAFGNNFHLLVAIDIETRNFIGAISVLTYPPPYSLTQIGLYVVVKKYRGGGIGSQLWNEAMKLATPNMFLYADEPMDEKYRDRCGFNKIPDWNLNMSTIEVQNVQANRLDHDTNLNIRVPDAKDWKAIARYHQKLLPQLNSQQLIKLLLSSPGMHWAIATDKKKEIVGLARIRDTYNHVLAIGPLYGDSLIVASSVLRFVLNQIPDLQNFKLLKTDWPTTNEKVAVLLNKLTNGNYETDTRKMHPQWTTEIFEIPTTKVFAISQPDLAII